MYCMYICVCVCENKRKKDIVLTNGTKGNKRILSGIDVGVIGPHSPHVSCTVDQPGRIKDHSVSQQARDKVTGRETLFPKVPRYTRGDKKAHHHHR